MFIGMEEAGGPANREATYGVGVWGCSAVYFNNSFTGVHQEIGEGFYSRNSFDKSLISYGGGPVNFGKSNQVTDSDLQIGPKVPKDSAEVKQLLNDFKWKNVEICKSRSSPRPLFMVSSTTAADLGIVL